MQTFKKVYLVPVAFLLLMVLTPLIRYKYVFDFQFYIDTSIAINLGLVLLYFLYLYKIKFFSIFKSENFFHKFYANILVIFYSIISVSYHVSSSFWDPYGCYSEKAIFSFELQNEILVEYINLIPVFLFFILPFLFGIIFYFYHKIYNLNKNYEQIPSLSLDKTSKLYQYFSTFINVSFWTKKAFLKIRFYIIKYPALYLILNMVLLYILMITVAVLVVYVSENIILACMSSIRPQI